VAGTAVVLVLMAPALVPHVARWVRTFPAPGAGGLSPDTVWWTVLAVCAAAIAVSVGGRHLPLWMTRVPTVGFTLAGVAIMIFVPAVIVRRRA
jgi:hypothetical protein